MLLHTLTTCIIALVVPPAAFNGPRVEDSSFQLPMVTNSVYGSIVLKDARLIVGSIGYGETSAAHLYERETVRTDAPAPGEWILQESFEEPAPPFGIDASSVATDHGLLVISRGPGSTDAFHERIPGGPWLAEGSVTSGGAIDIDDGVLAVGVFDALVGGVRAGAVEVFVRVGLAWKPVATLVPSDPDPFEGFGWAVALNADHLVVGSFRDLDRGVASGRVFVYRRLPGVDPNDPLDDDWSLETILVPPDPQHGEQFGAALDVAGDRIVVGSPSRHGANRYQGTVWVYREITEGNWELEGQLVHRDAAAYDLLGASLATDGRVVLAGAPRRDFHDLLDAGAAYVFTLDPVQRGAVRGPWIETEMLVPSDPFLGEFFGELVALDDREMLVTKQTYGTTPVYRYFRE